MQTIPLYPAQRDGEPLRLSPTDVSQFIRLDQCERYLRLRLHEHAYTRRFLADYGVYGREFPPLLSRTGRDFEEGVQAAIVAGAQGSTLDLRVRGTRSGARADDNGHILAAARDLPHGRHVTLFQPRLRVELNGWLLTGDVDVLRLERAADGALSALIVDIKSSDEPRVEYRLQVAFYHEMLQELFARHAAPLGDIALGILYRGPRVSDPQPDPDDVARLARDRVNAAEYFGLADGYLELIAERDNYLGSVAELITAADARGRAVAESAFDELPFTLDRKCDGCLYNEFCLKWCAAQDDLSLLPRLSGAEKRALQRNGVVTTAQLAAIKHVVPDADELQLAPNAEHAPLARQLATAWPVGPRLDELVLRAQRYQRTQGADYRTVLRLPHKGQPTLPASSADQHPNLVRVFVDAQHDYLHDRVYLLGALIVANEHGEPAPHRRASIVRLADGPCDTAARERALLTDWVAETVRAIVGLAAPNADGDARAPIHLIFYNARAQQILLEALARHFDAVLGATPLYDFVTQIAAYDTTHSTFLEEELRDRLNIPLLCQSLTAVSSYFKFDWDATEPFRDLFRARVFDSRGRVELDGAEAWITRRARFDSDIPLEYAYAAWRELADDEARDEADLRRFRAVTPPLLRAFAARRLDALEWIAERLDTNRFTTKSEFQLPDLASFTQKADTLAQALDEFVLIERKVELGEWMRRARPSAEQRMLAGDALRVRYVEEDQAPGVAEQNREHARRAAARAAYDEAWLAAHPTESKPPAPTGDLGKQLNWSHVGLRLRLRIEPPDGCDIEQALALSTIKEDEWLVLAPCAQFGQFPWEDAPSLRAVTPRQLLYATRCKLLSYELAPGPEPRAWAHVEIISTGGDPQRPGFMFFPAPWMDKPLVAGELYTLDPNPSNAAGASVARLMGELAANPVAANNALYARLTSCHTTSRDWPEEAAAAQARFLEGLEQLSDERGRRLRFEPSKQAFIARHGADPTLLVQGPPGSGKSFTTAYAVLARLQGAIAAGRECRVFIACHTHAAIDVLLEKIGDAQARLRRARAADPALFERYFDARVLDVPVYRLNPRQPPSEPLVGLYAGASRVKGTPKAARVIKPLAQCVVGGTPASFRSLIKEVSDNLFAADWRLADILVLDEASQLALPEAIMAALPLRLAGQLVVVGDHRQMAPIIKHDWEHEPRRTFAEFRSYESLFVALLRLDPPMIKFEESFRLHADVAEYLRQQIYHRDGIRFHSKSVRGLSECAHADAFVAAALAPEWPLTIITHGEHASQHVNEFEVALMRPLLEALREAPFALEPDKGVGVVSPHRAQRAALQRAAPWLAVVDPRTGATLRWGVDVVERFQGDERDVILVTGTESDPQYLLQAGEFLFDPRRLTVALSRARHKVILVAARTVFTLFTADDELFQHTQLWKNLLRPPRAELLWRSEGAAWSEGVAVEVWGHDPFRATNV